MAAQLGAGKAPRLGVTGPSHFGDFAGPAGQLDEHHGGRVASLNVATAAAVVLFELARRAGEVAEV